MKKAERRRIDAFELWCLRRLWRVPWSARKSNQSILKDISPGCSLEGMMLKLKLQYFGHLMQRAGSWKRLWCWEELGAGREGDDRWWDGWMASLPQWRGSVSYPGVGHGQGGLACCDSWGVMSRTRLSNWTELNLYYIMKRALFVIIFPQTYNPHLKIKKFIREKQAKSFY